MSIAHNRQEFVDAVDVAFNTVRVKQETDVILVEKPCTGREIEVGVLEEGNGKIIALSTGEILQNQLGSAQFYDYKTKYTCLTAAVCPANLDAQQDAEVKQIAIDVFDRLNLRGFARVDFFLQDKEILINEINTIPGFTIFSMYPRWHKATGFRTQS